MTGYSFTLSCPGCGGELVHVTNGSKRPWQQAAMAECLLCERAVLVNVDVSFAKDEYRTVQNYRMAEARRELDTEHEVAMERSRRALAGVA